MARIKKRKLAWAASTSPQVIGYKLYWADGEKVSYDSPSVALGNVTEVVLPDDIEGFNPAGGPVEFGITAMDELGNESDLITFSAAYQFNVPQAPEDLWLETMEDFHASDADREAEAEDPSAPEEEEDSSEPIILFDKVTPEAETEASTEEKEDRPTPQAPQGARVIQHYGHTDKP